MAPTHPCSSGKKVTVSVGPFKNAMDCLSTVNKGGSGPNISSTMLGCTCHSVQQILPKKKNKSWSVLSKLGPCHDFLDRIVTYPISTYIYIYPPLKNEQRQIDSNSYEHCPNRSGFVLLKMNIVF